MNKLAENIDDTFEENSTPVASKEELNADDFEVEVVDDTPEEDRVAKRKEAPEPEVEVEDQTPSPSEETVVDEEIEKHETENKEIKEGKKYKTYPYTLTNKNGKEINPWQCKFVKAWDGGEVKDFSQEIPF